MSTLNEIYTKLEEQKLLKIKQKQLEEETLYKENMKLFELILNDWNSYNNSFNISGHNKIISITDNFLMTPDMNYFITTRNGDNITL